MSSVRVFQKVDGKVIVTQNPIPGSACILMRIPLDVEQMVRQFFMNLARDRILFLYKTASAATCAVGTIKCIGVDSYQFTEYTTTPDDEILTDQREVSMGDLLLLVQAAGLKVVKGITTLREETQEKITEHHRSRITRKDRRGISGCV